MAGLIAELKRRNVFKVGAAYVVLAWLLAQVADLAAETFGAPDWVMKMLVTLLALLLPLVLFFAWAYELTPEGIKKEKDVDRSQSITRQTGRKLDFLVIGFLALALGYFVWESRFSAQKGSGAISEQAVAAQTAAAGEKADQAAVKSIAVLPFVNMSEDAGNEYFSDGISEEILNALAKVPELQVAGRTSSFAFKGHNEDLRQIGEALGVNHILEGSVRKAGDKVRITAQLIRVDNGFHLWSESYDRELTDVFAIQDEIANAILAQLKAQLVGGKPEVVASTRTDSKAYDLYLLAKQRMYERTRLPLESAAELLDQAIAIDPDYAPAYAQRGIVTNLLSETQYGTIPEAQSRSQSKLFIDQALRLDPELAEGWAALGLYYSGLPGMSDKAIAALEKARSLNSGLIDAGNWLNNAYVNANQPAPAKAVAVLQDIMQRDPLYKPGLGNLAGLYFAMGQADKARALTEKTRPFIPQDANIFWLDGVAKYWSGELAEALSLFETAVRLTPQDRVLRTDLSRTLNATHQYERTAEEGYWTEKIEALQHLGRVEEASLLAEPWASLGVIWPYFRLLNATGQSDTLVRYVEAHWPDLSAFATDFPPNGYVGYPEMIDIALAYRRDGNQQRFDDAMARVHAAQESLAEQGLSYPAFWTSQASYYALANDREQTLKFLAAAVDGGAIFATRISNDLPYFSEFEGDPEYEAIQRRMIEHLNRERQKLGLEPVST
jgi:TolB-like protein